MNDLIDLTEQPNAGEMVMIVGWRQWADAGSISSGLPEYLIEATGARKIGEIKSDDFYLFQFPGTHHYLRPEVNLVDGYPVALRPRKNEIYYTQLADKGLVIFLGDEPHLRVTHYTNTMLDLVELLKIRRVVAVGGVYGSMPYERDREVSCAFSLPVLKAELQAYAVRFSNYEGGATIGSYMLKEAERRAIEMLLFYAFVPAYDLSQLSKSLQGMRIENDYKAWYDLLRRLNHMFDFGLDLTDLEQHSQELLESMERKIEELNDKVPQVNVQEYLDTLSTHFNEQPFMPLDDVWERELGDLLDDLDE